MLAFVERVEKFSRSRIPLDEALRTSRLSPQRSEVACPSRALAPDLRFSEADVPSLWDLRELPHGW